MIDYGKSQLNLTSLLKQSFFRKKECPKKIRFSIKKLHFLKNEVNTATH